MNPLALVALLLQYPDTDLLAARAEIAEAVGSLEDSEQAAALRRFLPYWLETSPTRLQADYVACFDLGRRCSLHLTYPLHGERRERGMALLELKRRFQAAGVSIRGGELPDFLPVILEYAVIVPVDGAAVLAAHRVSLELLRAALHDAGDPHAHLVDAVCAGLGEASPAELERMRDIAAGGPPTESVGLEPFAPPEVMTGLGTGPRR